MGLSPGSGAGPLRPDIHRDGMLLVGTLVGMGHGLGLFGNPVDAIAYWNAGSSSRLYPDSWSEVGTGYLFYPPPVAQVSGILQPIGWPAFVFLLTVATFVALWYCARAWSFPLLLAGVPHFLGVGPPEPAVFLSYALLGNLHWILAACAVLAFRSPPVYAVLVSTKVTIAIGWWWHVFREEWRAAAQGAITAGLVMLGSVLVDPVAWVEFADFVARNFMLQDPPLPLFPIPLAFRLPMAIALVMWGARTDRCWTVPVAAGWSIPALYGWSFLPFWVGALRLLRDSAPGSGVAAKA
jgi:hypothetical protein